MWKHNDSAKPVDLCYQMWSPRSNAMAFSGYALITRDVESFSVGLGLRSWKI